MAAHINNQIFTPRFLTPEHNTVQKALKRSIKLSRCRMNYYLLNQQEFCTKYTFLSKARSSSSVFLILLQNSPRNTLIIVCILYTSIELDTAGEVEMNKTLFLDLWSRQYSEQPKTSRERMVLFSNPGCGRMGVQWWDKPHPDEESQRLI